MYYFIIILTVREKRNVSKKWTISWVKTRLLKLQKRRRQRIRKSKPEVNLWKNSYTTAITGFYLNCDIVIVTARMGSDHFKRQLYPYLGSRKRGIS